MADNIAVTAGTGTTVATEDVSGVHHQKVKIEFGGDGAATLVSSSDPLPVVGTVDLGATDNAVLDAIEVDTTSIDSKIPALGQALAAASVPVVLTAAQITTLTPPAAITGFATSAKQDTIIGHVDGIEGLLTTIDSDTGTIATEVAGLLTDTELRATPVPVSGTVAVTNAGITTIAGAVSGTEMQVDVLTMPTTAVTNAGITTIAGAVSGTEMQVDVLTMPTTTVTATDLDIRPLVNTDVVTAELSAVDNTVLDTIAAKDFATQTTLSAINAKMVSGTDIGDVTVNNASGAAAVNIQDGGNTITVDGTVAVTNSDITSIKTAVETLDNAISGSEMQVDVVGALPAGTNAIGKLAANSGVDIGDVDVTSVPRSLSGPGQPGTAIDSYTQVAISAVTGTDQSLIAAPGANKQIWVYGIGFTCSVAGTVAIQDEDNTAITGVVSYAQYSGPLVSPSGNFSMPLWKVATNKALEADVTTATINGWINYAIVSV